jgi:hypothetical protein
MTAGPAGSAEAVARTEAATVPVGMGMGGPAMTTPVEVGEMLVRQGMSLRIVVFYCALSRDITIYRDTPPVNPIR